MKTDDIKDRIDKVDDRLLMLFKKYPLVGAAVFLVGLAVGLAIGAWVL